MMAIEDVGKIWAMDCAADNRFVCVASWNVNEVGDAAGEAVGEPAGWAVNEDEAMAAEEVPKIAEGTTIRTGANGSNENVGCDVEPPLVLNVGLGEVWGKGGAVVKVKSAVLDVTMLFNPAELSASLGDVEVTPSAAKPDKNPCVAPVVEDGL